MREGRAPTASRWDVLTVSQSGVLIQSYPCERNPKLILRCTGSSVANTYSRIYIQVVFAVQEEYLRFLQRYEIEHVERYLFKQLN
jgi:hypothetical protein